MKKFFYLFSATLLTLTSCSKDENTSEPISSMLVKKMIRTYSVDDIVKTTYKYDGNKIVSASSDGGFVANYTYTGNVITKIEERVNNNFQSSMEYTYRDGKVATSVLKRSYGGTIAESYTYNTDGTISYERSYNGIITTGVFTFLNGNIVKYQVFSNGSPAITNTFEFDKKNNPFKNILGFNLLFDHNVDTFSSNNRIKDSNDGSDVNYTFKYDANNFLLEKTRINASSGNELTQYFY